MPAIAQIRQSLIIALWFMFLTFPILVVRVNTIENIIEWRWLNMMYVGAGSFLGSFAWRYFLGRRERSASRNAVPAGTRQLAAVAVGPGYDVGPAGIALAGGVETGRSGGVEEKVSTPPAPPAKPWLHRLMDDRKLRRPLLLILAAAGTIFPFLPFASTYQINIVTNALLYVMLGL
ncbi:MAG TPA: hypothetical protein PLT63_04000, partial [Syntrophales bacterium]|nr:hypothetical protein [Syntrophales bacterium]